MKGVVLCGGTGSRLEPLTRVTNKHLLPVYDRPMVFFPIWTLVHAGIRDIMLVTGGNNAGDFVPLLGNGADFGLKQIGYTYQKGAGGIADALRLARDFVGSDGVVVVLGDNIFSEGMGRLIREEYESRGGLTPYACVFLKKVADPRRFGVARFRGDRLDGIEEKPKEPPSPLAVTGCYIYDSSVFDFIDELKPSGRGELEITDVNNRYLVRGGLRFRVLGDDIEWTDAGTFESLHRANLQVAAERARKPGVP